VSAPPRETPRAPLAPPTLDDVVAARERIRGSAVRTPLLRLPAREGERAIWLKPECLQPVGSFKIRGAANALARIPSEELARGIYTASAGNMAQGVAWCARTAGVPCTVVAPDHAPRAKLDAIERLGARVVLVPFPRWWQTMVERSHPGIEGRFVHPVSDSDVIAGNGTIGLEILEDLPDVAAVLVPYGGGGLSSGIAAALRAAGSRARVFACEVETAAPLAPSLAAGEPRTVEYRASFVDGIGSPSLLPEMWPLVSTLLAGSCVVSLAEIAEAMRVLVARARLVAEGAGAASLAAALAARPTTGARGDTVALPEGPIVCVISGGNVDPTKLSRILAGDLP
jgi:threonine dehydratase